VRAIPWPSGRWRARRRIDTGHAGPPHGRERARGHVQPRCRGGGRAERGKGCRRRHDSGGGPPASRDANQRGRHSAAQCTYARRAGRPTRRTNGRVGLTAARRGDSNRAARWRQKLPTSRRYRTWRRHDHPRVIVGGSNSGSRRSRSPRATRGAMGGGRGSGCLRPLWQDSLSHTLTSIRF